MARVVDYLDKINDPRRTAYGNIRHKLIDIIVRAFTAVLCGYEDYEEMEEFGRLKLDCLRRVHTQNPLTGSRGSFGAGLLIISSRSNFSFPSRL
ncbi:MAG: transposase family protein [Treponema sp.]|nr:transposase family protein [Treponema sp.]